MGSADLDFPGSADLVSASIDIDGLDTKESVVAATDGGNVNLSSSSDPNPIDGVTLADEERVLLKDQSTSSENGIYVATNATDPTTWERADDMDEDDEISGGSYVFVDEGTNNAHRGYLVTTDDPISIGDSLSFGQFTGAGQLTAGDGLTKSGDTINHGGGNVLTTNADTVDVSIGNGVEDNSGTLRVDPAGFAGDGLKETSATSLGVEPADFAGTLLSDDGSDNLQVDEGTIDHDAIDQTAVNEDDHHVRGGLSTPTEISSATTASGWDSLRTDTSGGAFTVTLPDAPADGTEVRVTHRNGSNTLTISANTSDTKLTGDDTTSTVGESLTYEYHAAQNEWGTV